MESTKLTTVVLTLMVLMAISDQALNAEIPRSKYELRAAELNRFIATLDEKHNPEQVAEAMRLAIRQVWYKSTQGRPWHGAVEQTHTHTRTAILIGEGDVCGVVKPIPGVLDCHPDSDVFLV